MTTSKTTFLQRASSTLPAVGMLLLCIYVVICIVGETSDGIEKVSDKDAHCYIHRNYISCVPKSSQDQAAPATSYPLGT